MEISSSIKTYIRLAARVLGCTLVVMFALVAMQTQAHAAPAATLSIPVEQIFTGSDVQQERGFDYSLARLDASYPLPLGYVGDSYTFVLTGTGAQMIGPITFSNSGLYTYEIRSVETDSEELSVDSRIYTVIIAVRNTEGGFSAEIYAVYVQSSADSEKIKTDQIIFEKEDLRVLEDTDGEDPDPIPTPPPPGTITNDQRPSQGPKTGDYAEPLTMLLAMAISATLAFFALALIYMDRKGEKESEKIRELIMT